MGLVDDLLVGLDDILGVRDELGIALKPVYLLTRTWTGAELGLGVMSETKERMLPSPKVVEFKHDHRIKEGGFAQVGDVMIKTISKQSYPNKTQVDGISTTANVERFYEVGGLLYRVISIQERHLTWNVHLRPITDQTRS